MLCIRRPFGGMEMQRFLPALVLSIFAIAAVGLGSKDRSLSLEERVMYQKALEEVYWKHRIWPAENPTLKPGLQEVMPLISIRTKTEEYLHKSASLKITDRQLREEVERMARETNDPEMLRELWAALNNDRFLVAECLARPLLVERLTMQHSNRLAVAASAPTPRTGHTAVWTGTEMIVWGTCGSNSAQLRRALHSRDQHMDHNINHRCTCRPIRSYGGLDWNPDDYLGRQK